MNRHFEEMLSALFAAGAEFLLVGAHALAAHGVLRATGDLDLWIRPTPENAQRVFEALMSFGAPLTDLTVADLHSADLVFQVGLPPSRIDLLTSISGIDFDSAWQNRVVVPVSDLAVPCLSRQDFVTNKRATGRPRDLADVAMLEEQESE